MKLVPLDLHPVFADMADDPIIVPARIYKGRYGRNQIVAIYRYNLEEVSDGDIPVVMRGSRFAMMWAWRSNKSAYWVTVVERFFRIKKLTFVDIDDFNKFASEYLVPSLTKGYRRDLGNVRRIIEEVMHGKHTFLGKKCLINGQTVYLKGPQLTAVTALNKKLTKLTEVA